MPAELSAPAMYGPVRAGVAAGSGDLLVGLEFLQTELDPHWMRTGAVVPYPYQPTGG